MQSYRPPHQHRPEETRNLMIAIFLSVVVLGCWQYFYEYPRRQQEAAAQLQQEQRKQAASPAAATASGGVPMQPAGSTTPQTREQALQSGRRIAVESPELKGSLALTGARLDDLTLTGYKDTLAKDSPDVVLLAPSTTRGGYFADLGWASADTAAPSSATAWEADGEKLTPQTPLHLHWTNADGVRFETTYAIDAHFMFTITQNVINGSGKPVTLAPYGLVNRELDQEAKQFKILHEGPLGVASGALQEVQYKDLRESGPQSFDTPAGWLGITDKYWLTALAPVQPQGFTERFRHFAEGPAQHYQADYTGKPVTLAPGAATTATTHFFAGAKRVDLLDEYSQKLGIPLFSRAVDFGRLYFLTIPIFHLLHYFHSLLGNFGLAILLLTVCIKALMFPLAYKSYGSMAQMKRLNPKMAELKERYADDRLKLNQEVIQLYKTEKVNPASGCLPMLIQVPVFFSLYKVLFVTIEMRHAPFFGWIHDLSAPDPTNLFTLFGLLPWDTNVFGFHLQVGIWPMIMAGTMLLQQKINPKPADATQAQVMAMLPWFFLFLFASFPAGLVIYWAWSNTITIIQQLVIMRRHEAKAAKPRTIVPA